MYENRLMVKTPIYADWENDLVIDAAREDVTGKAAVFLFAETRSPASICARSEKIIGLIEKNGIVTVGNRRVGLADAPLLRSLARKVMGAKRQVRHEIAVRAAITAGAPRPEHPCTGAQRRKRAQDRVYQKKTVK